MTNTYFPDDPDAWMADSSFGPNTYTIRRFFRWDDATPDFDKPLAPSAGGSVDGVSVYPLGPVGGPPGSTTNAGYSAATGRRVKIEAGASFSAAANLKTTSVGKAIAQGGSGTIVARALEAASGDGDVVWIALA